DVLVDKSVSPRLLLPHGRVRNRRELIVGRNVRPRDKAAVSGRPVHRDEEGAFRTTRLGDSGKRTGSREYARIFQRIRHSFHAFLMTSSTLRPVTPSPKPFNFHPGRTTATTLETSIGARFSSRGFLPPNPT